MLKQDKERVVAELVERLRASQTLIVADYRGLSMPEIDELRTQLLAHGARFSVVKNTLTRRAAAEAGVDALLELLEGPTAIAFIEPDGDPVAVAKVLNAAARANDVLVVRGGVLEGGTITEADVRNLATLPPLDVLRGQLVSAVAGPLIMIVGLFTAPLRDLVGVIDARIRQLEEQGGGETSASADDGGGDAVAAQADESPHAEADSETTSDEAAASADDGGGDAVAAQADESPQAEADPEATNDESPEADQASGENGE